jgi:hypothetical protein
MCEEAWRGLAAVRYGSVECMRNTLSFRVGVIFGTYPAVPLGRLS